MKLDFDLAQVKTVEFGVQIEGPDADHFRCVPVDVDVQDALTDMSDATWEAMRLSPDGPSQYQPSEKHASTEYLYLRLDANLADGVRALQTADNLPIDASALDDPKTVVSYFARLTDSRKRRLTALRRASQFKGVLKGRLIRLVTNSLRLIEDKVFRLDTDFDVLIDSSYVHILRPNSFEFACKLQDAVMAAVPQNIKTIANDLSFVDFGSIGQYASKHPRAARYLASIRSQEETRSVDKGALRRLCKATGVVIRSANGRISVETDHVLGFLEVLDRRRYEILLVKNTPERFRAGSRQRLDD
jgi:hypothetical protein